MDATLQEIQVGTYLEVPRFLGLVADSVLYIIVVLCCMFYIVVAAHGILLVGVEVGLQDVGEHLDVVAAHAVAL